MLISRAKGAILHFRTHQQTAREKRNVVCRILGYYIIPVSSTLRSKKCISQITGFRITIPMNREMGT